MNQQSDDKEFHDLLLETERLADEVGNVSKANSQEIDELISEVRSDIDAATTELNKLIDWLKKDTKSA